MRTEFVMALVDVNCKWNNEPPRYRCYVNDELFTERTWIWTEHYLEEQFQIQAEPGEYEIRYELVNGSDAKLKASNYRIIHGPAYIDQKGHVTIWENTDENA